MRFWVALLLSLALPCTLFAIEQDVSAVQISCPSLQGPSLSISAVSCVWPAPAAPAQNVEIVIAGGQSNLSVSATPTVVAGEALASQTAGALGTPGLKLSLQRLVLVGFEYAASGGSVPVLWPAGLLAASGSALVLTDVRLVSSSQQQFNSWLAHFTSNSEVVFWTDNSTFLYIHQWTDNRTILNAVGLLLEAPQGTPNPYELPRPLVQNSLIAATNSTLLPALKAYADVPTQQPLIVFITTNVSIGAHPKLPASGIAINRPVVFVGLQSQPTSIDFEMVVNQLNATGSKNSNVTFVGLALESLAPGDAATSVLAAPLSIAICNNVWAVYYNRSAANDVRLTLFNTTLVLPTESEMAYVTYMFTLYTSSLPYLKEQTRFYSDVIHISILQFSPGPGSRAISVSRLKSWFHWWRNVVLTVDPVAAAQLPLPPGQLMLQSSTQPSPLVQAVHDVDSLKTNAEMLVADRQHILLILSNISLADSIVSGKTPSNGTAADAIWLNSDMSWVGSPPAEQSAVDQHELQHSSAAATTTSKDSAATVAISLGYLKDAFVIPNESAAGALQLQQLVLLELPQGPGVTAVSGTSGVERQAGLWTILLWSFRRPPQGKALSLNGVTLLLPGPELEYITAAAERTSDFVIPLPGNGNALTFQDASVTDSGVNVASFQGPGMTAVNLTLMLDPVVTKAINLDASTAMPNGYFFSDPGVLQIQASKGQPAWVVAVIVVSAVVVAALGAYAVYRSRRVPCFSAPSKHMLLDSPRSKRTGSGSTCPRQAMDSGTFALTSSSTAGCKAAGQVCDTVKGEEMLTGGTADSVTDMTVGQKSTAHIVLEPAAIVAGTLQKQLRQQQQGGKAEQLQRTSTDRSPSGENHMDQTEIDNSAVPVVVADSLASSVAAGMQHWRAAISSTTMLLMERRLDAANLPLVGSSCTGSIGASSVKQQPSGSCILQDSRQQPEQQVEEAAGQDAGLQQPAESNATQLGVLNTTPPQLQLLELLGQGSCGCVYLALWRGKRVAVKVMHLPANALLGQQGAALAASAKQHSAQGGAEARRVRVKQQNSAPHMAIMEAVLSSAMSHPNVVQVYTYMLSPLTRTGSNSMHGCNSSACMPTSQDIAGWELKLIMEYCNEGSLRDALDCGLLSKPGGFLAPSVVLALAHDVAAAMLHLHSEGIVHADLKAANVMLTTGSDDTEGVWAAGQSGKRLVAKVADFGLALPLDPSDTHATLSARGTPTHMSPELFMSGHVSKACDIWAYGILLYEIMTGQRAYAGVPIPLLPHEVARQGLRPTWPPNLPAGCRDLRRLAEACWAQQPQDRPTFGDILKALDHWSSGGYGFPPTQAAAAGPACTLLPSALQQHQQQVQLAQVVQQPGAAAALVAAAAAAGAQRRQVQVQVHVPPESVQESTQQPEAEDGWRSRSPPCLPSQPSSLQRSPSSATGTSTPDVPGALSSELGKQHAAVGRNMHMDWSEVDFAGA